MENSNANGSRTMNASKFKHCDNCGEEWVGERCGRTVDGVTLCNECDEQEKDIEAAERDYYS